MTNDRHIRLCCLQCTVVYRNGSSNQCKWSHIPLPSTVNPLYIVQTAWNWNEPLQCARVASLHRAVLPRDAAMLARYWNRNYVRPSHACFVTKRKKHTADILIPHETAITICFLTTLVRGDIPFYVKFAVKVTHPFEKSRLRPISAYNVSAVRASEKLQLSQI